jgi:hypothetical protein
VGFGTGMANSDMIIWQANGTSSIAQDYWCTGYTTPSPDLSQDVVTTYTTNDTYVIFVS